MPHARHAISRRRALQVGSAAVCAGFSIHSVRGDEQRPGFVVGEATATKVGEQVLADGGNAVDAIVAAALAGAVAAPHQTGPGGYGMTAVVARNGRQIAAIDGNSAAPAAMTRDFFKTDSQGRVPGRVNHTGWLAAGVPGVLAGLQKLLDAFGSGVTVGELGLTLGHGMSRFDTHPDHPNSPGPGKRPLHNMCPTIVTRDGRAVLAIGGAGGRRIPNSVLDVLTHFVALRQPLAKSMAAPRLHTEGTKALTLQSSWAESDIAALRDIGYQVTIGAGARISAVAWENDQLLKESS